MGFDKEWNGSSEFTHSVAEDGAYPVELSDIQTLMLPSFNDPAVEEPRVAWRFKTTKHVDEAGKPYEFTVWSSRKYGHDKSKLTQLLDGMLGYRMTKDEWDAFDIDSLIGQQYQALVTQAISSKGEPINKVASVKPLTPPQRSVDGAGRMTTRPVSTNGKPVAAKRPLEPVGKAAGPLMDAKGRTPDDPGYDPYED